jgi:hypothetical protein
MELPEEIPCHSLQFYRFWWGYHISFYVFRFFFGTDLKTRWICFWLSYWMIPLISPGAGSGTWRATNPATGRLWFARSVGCSLARKGSELALAINRHQQSRLGPKDTMGTTLQVEVIQRLAALYENRLQPNPCEMKWTTLVEKWVL